MPATRRAGECDAAVGTNYYLQRVAGHEVFDEWPAADLDSASGVRFHPVSKRTAADFCGNYPDDPPNVGSFADLWNILCRGDYGLVVAELLDDPRFAHPATTQEILDALGAVAVPFSAREDELYRAGDYVDPQGYLFFEPKELEADFMLRRLAGRIEHEAIHLCKCSWGWRTTWQASDLVRSVADARALVRTGEWRVVSEDGEQEETAELSLARLDALCSRCPDGRDMRREYADGTYYDPEGYIFATYDFC